MRFGAGAGLARRADAHRRRRPRSRL